jgi:signal transduction histidine kinase
MSAAVDRARPLARDMSEGISVTTAAERALFDEPLGTVADFGSLRVGVERGMVAALAIASILLTASTVPVFDPRSTDRAFVGEATSLALSAAMVVSLIVPLLRRGMPSRGWLWCAATAYVLLIVAHRLIPARASFTVSDPWPFSFGCVAFGCVAIGTRRPRRALAACLLVICSPTLLYARSLPVAFVAVAVGGLVGMSIALVFAVTALRNRADWADAAQRAADDLFSRTQREIAVEAERIRTDALIHDTVLAALLTAASTGAAATQVKAMAAAALEVVSDTAPRLAPTSVDVRFGDALDDEAAQLGALHSAASIDFGPILHVRMPEQAASALIRAAMQAATNSHRHAGEGASCTLVAEPLDGGVRIVVSDDGDGFDMAALPPERLGVRVSILERVQDIGGTALIDSAPGRGTTVTLGWRPEKQPSSAHPGVRILSRRLLLRVLAVVVGIAIAVASLETLIVYKAIGPVIAVVLGVALLPVLLRGARTGAMRTGTAWSIVAVGCLIIVCGPIGLEPAQQTAVSIAWYTCGVIAGAAMLRMTGHRLPPFAALLALLVYVTVWAGPVGMIRIGLAGEVVLYSVGMVLNHAIVRVNRISRAATDRERRLALWQAQTDAYNSERRRRLLRAGRDAAPALQQVVDQDGDIGSDVRAECRVLEQALRDEIRGRTLLNDAVRTAVRTQRRRGTTVQILDDGGLDDTPILELPPLLDQVAELVRPLTSSRIIIRTGQPDTDIAVSIVASTPDETAAALGLDADDTIDLWATIPRPTSTPKSPGPSWDGTTRQAVGVEA